MSSTAPRSGSRHTVGIDVSKRTLDVCLMPQGESFVLPNDQEGIDELLSRLEGTQPELVVLEATGRYERLAATSIAAAGIAVAIVNPLLRPAISPRPSDASPRPTRLTPKSSLASLGP